MYLAEGFWLVQFAGMEGLGAGVAVLSAGKVLGGDSGFTYIGTYESSERGVRATVLVENFDPKIGSVLAIKGDFKLSLDVLWLDRNTLRGNATLVTPPGIGIAVKLTRKSDL